MGFRSLGVGCLFQFFQLVDTGKNQLGFCGTNVVDGSAHLPGGGQWIGFHTNGGIDGIGVGVPGDCFIVVFFQLIGGVLVILPDLCIEGSG